MIEREPVADDVHYHYNYQTTTHLVNFAYHIGHFTVKLSDYSKTSVYRTSGFIKQR